MFYLQLFIPATLVFLLFGIGHLYVEVDYSGVYFKEAATENLATETGDSVVDEEELTVELDDNGLPLLVDKYNYLKIENVFQGRLLDTQELFSLEIAIATYQMNVTADFFIKGIYEIESNMVSEISTLILDTTSEKLTTLVGRKSITDKIMNGLNDYLVGEGFSPDIHYVYIINYNII
jgi:flagellar basal body-associated protein FliL